ncbi:PilZ domain-containing protein [Acinetobacter shaoyimingii]|uniref:PilZ domain-containing protein n=1 Tax=Acinetobacter shaoyimingii TaxID=2715164 RepID=A0A6G8RU43_9GAMM|nr:PilZ domain-containing protein [Acinetobacter shaoyimingii]NHB58462.1 PilZ domain-containing protein [Acinetobacter shaoyimingii]QIO05434.1 PilZ domain-containing protein [Acinetobacter shaoyimingii]
MEAMQHQNEENERRVMSRIDAALRINYQIISDEVALNDPYDANFVLPRYFLLLAELDQFDHALLYELEQLNQKDQQIARILSLFNQKLNLITGSLYDSIVQTMLPIPQNVNISESGFGFYTNQAIAKDSYIHVTISHPENFFHIAAIAMVAYSKLEDNDMYKIGAYFVTLHPQDKVKIASCINSIRNNQSD